MSTVTNWTVGDLAVLAMSAMERACDMADEAALAAETEQEYCESCMVIAVDTGEKYCVSCANDVVEWLAQQWDEQTKGEHGWY